MASAHRRISAKRFAAAPAEPIYIDWQGRMNFDGSLARFERSVVCQTESRTLRTELLDVTMCESALIFHSGKKTREPKSAD